MALSAVLIRHAREAAGMTRTELGAAIGRTEQTIIAYEHGRAVPPTTVVAAIADTLGVHPGHFFEHEPGTSP